jgi:uncharacterized LabA/DUF88 family protein
MRVWFFIDGFNFYHSVQAALKDRPQKRLMWLNLKKLCEQHLHVIGRQATLAGVDYFTAIPLHLVSNPNADADAREKAIRHKLYIRANEAHGVSVYHGRIDPRGKELRKPDGAVSPEWREKGTDVMLACTVLERAQQDSFDLAVIISGDTDYLPLTPILQRMFSKELRFGLPYKRETKLIKNESPLSFSLTIDAYEAAQFDQALQLPNGSVLHCPKKWIPDAS